MIMSFLTNRVAILVKTIPFQSCRWKFFSAAAFSREVLPFQLGVETLAWSMDVEKLCDISAIPYPKVGTVSLT